MLKFKPIIINRKTDYYENVEYIPQIMFLYRRWEKFLKDDFAMSEESFYEYFLNLIEDVSPYFWVILFNNETAGFVYLENFTGDSKNLWRRDYYLF